MTIEETARHQIENYYDERVAGKLRDFTDANPRIEAALQMVAEWAPAKPKRILEIGCGIGASTWRMARAWPEAQVIGADVSPKSITVANTCFQLPNLSYRAGLVTSDSFAERFDLIVLMDVYEHIALADRPVLHQALNTLLDAEARIILTVPSTVQQNHDRMTNPESLQPVDEDITVPDVVALARDTHTRLLYYRELGIWRYCDYLHIVLGRYAEMCPVDVSSASQPTLRQNIRRFLLRARVAPRRDYIGYDVLRARDRSRHERFRVSSAERKALASLWQQSDRRSR